MADDTVKVGFSQSGETVTAHVKPGEMLVLDNVDFESTTIDILGPDVILTNPETGGKIFLPGLGLILFSETQSPQIMLSDNTEITPQMVLNKVGSIQNVTQEDFLTFTSLDINPEQGAEQQTLSGLEENTENEELRSKISEQQKELEEQQKKIEDQTEEFFGIASKLEDFTNEFSGENGAELRADPENDSTTPSDSTIDAIDSSRADFIDDATGAIVRPPAQPSAAGTPEEFDSEADDTDTGPGTMLAAASLELGATLLQVSAVDTLSSNSEFRGGGSSQAGAFDANNSAQFSTETIDTTVAVGDHTIFADNPDFFNPENPAFGGQQTLSRVIQISPAIPLGFDLDNITISGFPADFQIIGQTPDGNGDYSINSPTLDTNNNIELTIIYPVPNSQQFLLNISSSASFDPLSGLPTPDETTQSFEIFKKVEVRDVNDPSDGNFTDPGGNDFDGDGMADPIDLDMDGLADEVIVFANNANGNRIFTGEGNVTVLGGEGADQVTSSIGNDIINTAGGNDIVSAGDGDDIVQGGAGDDRLNGGNGIDTADFSDLLDDVNLDLNGAINGDGFIEASISNGETDELINFENITGGDGNDTLSGGLGINIIDGGAGDDTISGNLGDDTLIGGDGTSDTVDYSYVGNDDISVNLNGTATISINAGDVDTISGFENVITDDGDDTITGTSEDNIITSNAGDDTINAGGGNDTIDGGDGLDDIDAGAGDDIVNGGGNDDNITGGSGNDTIDAGSGNDTIDAGDNNDTIIASIGDDSIDGGTGVDTINYEAFGTGLSVVIDDSVGFSTLTIGAETDMIRNIENITATDFADTITGDGSSETFRGNAGDDIIDGGAGSDIIFGGLGSDTLTGGNGIDVLDFSDLNVGLTDFSTATGIATTAVDTDTFNGFEAYVLTNNSDSITASTNNDIINGGGGFDTIDYSAATGVDLSVNLSVTTSTVTGFGTDNLTSIENITTSTGNDVIVGSDADNIIIAGAGNDTVQGGRGNDILDGGTGTADILDYTEVNFATVEYDLTNINANGFLVTLNAESDRAQGFEIIEGGGGTDIFTGDANDNEFRGNNGSDMVNASRGNDIYIGGAANDILDYNNANFSANGITVDLSVVNGSGLSTVSFAGLAETHLVQGFTNIRGSGAADTITGSAVGESIRGLGGIDILNGGGGNDTLIADDAGGDTLNGGTGADTVSYFEVTSGINVTLVSGGATDSDGNTLSNIQNITGTGSADNITGDIANNTLSGGNGNDIIDGGDGNDTLNGGNNNDTLIGGIGNDTINGDAGDDTFIGGVGNDSFNGGTGSADLADYAAAGAGITVDLTLATAQVSDDGDGGIDTLTNVENIRGSSFDDVITGSTESGVSNEFFGGAGNDILSGGAGGDTLRGEDGNDTFIGSQGGDRFIGGSGIDTADYSQLLFSAPIEFDSSNNLVVNFVDFSFDRLTSVERIIGSDNADFFGFDTEDLADFSFIDAGGDNDSLSLDGLLLDDGDLLNSIFDNLESITFSNASLLGGDDFVLTGADIQGLTDANNTLNISIEDDFNLSFAAGGGFNDAGGFINPGAGNSQTFTFSNGGTNVDLVVAVNA